MSTNNPKHNRRSIRLPEYDYSQEGAYYITICTQDRICLFGEIRNGGIALSAYGGIVENWWQRIPERYAGVILDEYVIMPNHIHAIIVIVDDVICRGEVSSPQMESVDVLGNPGEGTSPLRGSDKHTLGQILAYYKYQTTKTINAINNTPGNKIWQRNYGACPERR